ncbi:hypothetical protein HLB35_15630 [Halomonas sp. TBZ9]|uniref:Calcium-binding protein n=1 Tax=Vreelandella azerica TaxID=2732867 RepID=A0A7Y3TZA3_9GAMM|nr:hypothetical protein [Halomonas azerica]NOG32829.1 hypothetical protein [Halomonas azerica]
MGSYDDDPEEREGITFDGVRVLEGRHENTLSFATYFEGVEVDLSLGTATALGSASGFGTLEGSNADDVLIADDAGITLRGLSGNDILQGGGGDDKLIGGAGDNLLINTGGTDTFVSETEGDDAF